MKVPVSHFVVLAALCAVPGSAAAANFLVATASSNTILRLEQRGPSLESGKEEVAPLTEFLGLEVERLADGNLSFHSYGWGRLDLADKSFNSERASGSLTYGYLQYHFKQANADGRLGRFFVHEGIVNEQVDGVGVRTDLPYGLALSAFGGATVHTAHIRGETSDGKGDALFGGRGSYRFGGILEVGLSGVYESNVPTLLTHLSGNHRLLGGDIWLSPSSLVELTGHTSYNMETSGIAEHSYLLNVRPVKDLTLSAEYSEQRDRNFFFAWSMFSGAALNPADKSRSVGTIASYRAFKGGEFSADYRRYMRERGNADRFGADAHLSFLGNKARGGVGYHYLRADTSFAISGTPSGSYHEARGYLMGDWKDYFGAVDVVAFLFKEKIFKEDSAVEAIASVGYRFTPDLALSGDVSYGRNPDFDQEVRGLLRLTYNMTYTGKGGSK